MTITVTHLGDSITAGQRVDPGVRWTTHIQRQLSVTFEEEVVSYNLGISGEQTRMALERFPKVVQEERPDVLTIQYGMTDCNCWLTDSGLPRVSEDAYAANLTEMVHRAQAHGTSHVILATSHPTLRLAVMPNGERYEAANARYSELLQRVAGETGVLLCDIRGAFERSEVDLEHLLIPEPDLLHLSEQGHRLYFAAIWPFVEDAVSSVLHDRVAGKA